MIECIHGYDHCPSCDNPNASDATMYFNDFMWKYRTAISPLARNRLIAHGDIRARNIAARYLKALIPNTTFDVLIGWTVVRPLLEDPEGTLAKAEELEARGFVHGAGG